MATRIAIVGPGRVGTAFARTLRNLTAPPGRVHVLGLLGRTAAATRRASERALVPELPGGELTRAHIVILSIGDADLPAAVQAYVSQARRGSLWLHTSGRHDLDVLAPLAARGARVGSLHPVCPFAEADVDALAMRDAPALLAGPARSLRLLHRLANWLGLQAIACGEQDRALYHASCALAANGTTALFDVAVESMRAAGGLAEGDAERIVLALAKNALSLSSQHGAAAALSGPVRRGDDETVAAHLAALDRRAPAARPGYVALMQHALQLAVAQGLPPELAQRLAALLESR